MPTDTNAKTPAKLSLPDLLLLGATGAILRFLLTAAMRSQAIHPQMLVMSSAIGLGIVSRRYE